MKGKFKIISSILLKTNLFTLAVCGVSANSCCCWIAHQPKLPEEVKKFKKI